MIVDGCRMGCDFMNLVFMFDEYSDAADARGARMQADVMLHALINPDIPRPMGEWIGGEATRQYVEAPVLDDMIT